MKRKRPKFPPTPYFVLFSNEGRRAMHDRTTRCFLFDKQTREPVAFGVSVCSIEDAFDARRGRYIAYTRAHFAASGGLHTGNRKGVPRPSKYVTRISDGLEVPLYGLFADSQFPAHRSEALQEMADFDQRVAEKKNKGG